MFALADKAERWAKRAAKQRRARKPKHLAPQLTGDLTQYAGDPVAFARDVFGIDLWEGQQKICLAVRDHVQTSCRSGHKCGKSTSVAVLAWWFAATRPGARVIITAPTGRQVKQVVWREIRRLWRCALKLGNPHSLPEPGLAPENGIPLPEDSQILGFTAENQEAMAGISAPEMLFIVDEASGVDEAIYEAIQGNMAGGAKLVLISNPTQTVGTFFDSHHKARSDYECVHISSEDTPNAKGNGPAIKGLASKEWVDRLRRIWGEDDPRYQVRVKGNFPSSNPNAIIGIGLLEKSHERHADLTDTSPERHGALVLGVDVARFGDDSSVIQPVRGLYAYKPRAVYGYDTIQVAGKIIEAINDLRVSPGEAVTVNIDAGGGYGGGVADQVRASVEELGMLNVTVCELHPSAMAADAQYDLKRDELWFGIRSWLEQGGALPKCEDLDTELLAPVYTFTIRGSKIKVEPKDEIKKRIGRSPDYADALALAVTREPQTDWDLVEEMAEAAPKPLEWLLQ